MSSPAPAAWLPRARGPLRPRPSGGRPAPTRAWRTAQARCPRAGASESAAARGRPSAPGALLPGRTRKVGRAALELGFVVLELHAMGPHGLVLLRRALLPELCVCQAHPWSWCRRVTAFTADVPRVLCVDVSHFVLLSVHRGALLHPCGGYSLRSTVEGSRLEKQDGGGLECGCARRRPPRTRVRCRAGTLAPSIPGVAQPLTGCVLPPRSKSPRGGHCGRQQELQLRVCDGGSDPGPQSQHQGRVVRTRRAPSQSRPQTRGLGGLV